MAALPSVVGSRRRRSTYSKANYHIHRHSCLVNTGFAWERKLTFEQHSVPGGGTSCNGHLFKDLHLRLMETYLVFPIWFWCPPPTFSSCRPSCLPHSDFCRVGARFVGLPPAISPRARIRRSRLSGCLLLPLGWGRGMDVFHGFYCSLSMAHI